MNDEHVSGLFKIELEHALTELQLKSERIAEIEGNLRTYVDQSELYIRRAHWSQKQFGDSAHHRKRLAPLLSR
ncbi:MAG: hypothetical protein JKX81_18885 [Arenicella sp.]|nr:hypothetical protein [Arenicella sp.]